VCRLAESLIAATVRGTDRGFALCRPAQVFAFRNLFTIAGDQVMALLQPLLADTRLEVRANGLGLVFRICRADMDYS